MRHLPASKSAFAVVLLALLIAFSSSAAFAQSAFTLTPIVKRFDPVPDGGRFFDCGYCRGDLSFHAFNNLGDVIIYAETSNFFSEGLYFISGEKRELISAIALPSPYGELHPAEASLNDQGQIVFTAYAYKNGEFDKIILFLYANGQIVQIAVDGEPTPAGIPFSQAGIGEPQINNNGEIIFEGFSRNGLDPEGADMFLYSNGSLRSLVSSGTSSPVGGVFDFTRLIAVPQINSQGDVLFYSSFYSGSRLNPTVSGDGLFLVTREGIKKIVVQGDSLPTGRQASYPTGTLNNKGEIAFISNVTNIPTEHEGGIYLYSRGQIKKIVTVDDPTPIGGKFAPFTKVFSLPAVLLNNNGAVAFKALVNDGSISMAIFLASPSAMVKVVAVGEPVDGGKIAEIGTYALNDAGQIAFVALDKQRRTLGVFKATPITPEIASIKLKRKKGALELRVTGNGFITNDSIIEINGVALDAMSYPEVFRENGGTTRQIISRDARLEQLLTPGQTAQIKVFSSLTNRRSEVKEFTR